MQSPLITVVCLCYNHERFVKDALESVFNQTHQPVQLIVIDDASTDGSVGVIRDILKEHPDVPFLALEKNNGNCRAFNQAIPFIKGEFVIDLSADDILLPSRMEEGVRAFNFFGKEYGIHFSDAENISEDNKHLSFHSDRFSHVNIPQGDVYAAVIEKYFICGPSVMMRKQVLERMNGYDETLTYEDFDLWIRAARDFKFCYTPKVLIKRRQVATSLGQQQFKRGSAQLISTYKVCLKIQKLNRSRYEQRALSKRITYEITVALRLLNFALATRYFFLWCSNQFPVLPDKKI
jgi:glycosyltransferase involved in cell wall biosynthesis